VTRALLRFENDGSCIVDKNLSCFIWYLARLNPSFTYLFTYLLL